MGKVINWELCKKLKFDHTNKWYIHNSESVPENETHKLFGDFEMQTDHLISARRPGLIIINKKERTCRIVDFAVSADHRVKSKECEKRYKYLDLTRERKNLSNMKVTVIPIVIGAFGTVTKGLVQGLKDLEITGRVVGWLVVWVLWHINLCRLFNAKLIFIQIISNNFISSYSVYSNSSN